MPGEIHDEHPFATPEDERDPVRRFRGRLAAPVTIITSGSAAERTGLTVSSLIVAEGDPSYVHFLCGPTTDLWHAIGETGAFIVHILEEDHRGLSDRFAGIRPSPGGLFTGFAFADTDFGPSITSLQSRAYCRFVDAADNSEHLLVRGVIERVEVHDLREPLRYFRGSYATG